jgi:hypothetical protein
MVKGIYQAGDYALLIKSPTEELFSDCPHSCEGFYYRAKAKRKMGFYAEAEHDIVKITDKVDHD